MANLLKPAAEIINAASLLASNAAETAGGTSPGILGNVEQLITLADRGITLLGQGVELIGKVQTMMQYRAAVSAQASPELPPVLDAAQAADCPPWTAPQPAAAAMATTQPAQLPAVQTVEQKQTETGQNMKIEIDYEILTEKIIPFAKAVLSKSPDITIGGLCAAGRELVNTAEDKTKLIRNKTLAEVVEFAEKDPEALIRVINFFG